MSELTRDAVSVRKVFDAWALAGRAEGMEKGHGPSARAGFDALSVGSGTRYLDIGCGNGYTVRWAASAGAVARGIDISPEMIRRAEAMSSEHPDARFSVSTFPDDDISNASIDAVFSMEVFYYLEDLDLALRRVRDILAPGGRFACVVDFYAENTASHSWPEDLGVHMTLRSERGWRLAFEKAGLDVVMQDRVRLSPEDASSEWKVRNGSLLTVGQRSE